jgi:ferredoxin
MAWIIGIGVRFGMFIAATEQGNSQPFFTRPPGVEGFLPIGALTSLKYWLASGTIHSVHPAALVTAVSSPECTGCLTCVSNCPEQNVLAMQPLFWKQPLPFCVFPAVVVSIFMVGIGVGMVSGHWHSSLNYSDYQQLLPLVPELSH